MYTIHVYPLDDAMDHDIDTVQPDCVCGPASEGDRDGGWLLIHHALDGLHHEKAAHLVPTSRAGVEP